MADEIVQYGAFSRGFRVFSLETADHNGLKIDLKKWNKLNKIILPRDALDHLSGFNIPTPYYFRVTTKIGLSTYVSVVDYHSTPNTVFMPTSVMTDLSIIDNDTITLDSVTLPKAKSCTIETTKSFGELENPKLLLDRAVRGLSLLKEGMVIQVFFAKKIYDLTVRDLKPTPTASVIDAEVAIQFTFIN